MMRWALVVTLWLGFAAPAGAATVAVDGTALTIVAGPGELNVVDISLDPREGFFVRDPGAPLVAGAGCRGPSSGPLVCDRAGSVHLDLGDGDDRAAARLPLTVPLLARGGPGDDEISGGDGDDVLQGGPGDDVLDGDYGDDVADYDDHSERVDVDVTGPGPVGAAGERDVLSGIESAWGGAGDDRIRAAGRRARCGAGADRLTPAGDSGFGAALDCELIAFSPRLAVEGGARLDGRRVRFVLRGRGSSARLRVRVGRFAARRRVVFDYGGRRAVSLRLPTGVAARLRRGGALRITAGGRTLALRVSAR